MYKYEKLTKFKFPQFELLNNSRENFNTLNQDFFEIYYKSTFTSQFFLRNQIKMLKYNQEYIGYLWAKKNKSFHYTINSLNIVKQEHIFSGARFLINTFKNNCILEYECERNDFNFSLLSQLGFNKKDGTIELTKRINSPEPINTNSVISFESFIKGVHEEIRCALQNDIFKHDEREPLTLNDIYYDTSQEYFWDEGSIFIKYDNIYIGYGQIIVDGNTPTIVNFGIINEFRLKGYGKLLLSYLINILYNNYYKEVKIKVNSNNLSAYQLYLKFDFIKNREYYNWILKIDN